MIRIGAALGASTLFILLVRGQEPFRPTTADVRKIQSKVAELTAAADSLRAARVDDDLLVDIDVCLRAAQNTLRFPEEFFDQRHVDNAVSALDRGLERARQVREGKPVWPTLKGRVSRAYRSRVDGVPQPYRVIIPESYDPAKPARLYVYLHGRGDTDFEVNWVAGRDIANPAPVQVPYIQLQAFGRGNTNFLWAGETDVFEAVESVRKRYNIDPDRIVLRGFSMGGAGAWHIGLHHPDEWAALEAGAGNTRSRRYADMANVPTYQQATMRIYEDMMDYALNVFDLPTAGYGGENDPQLQASVNVREELEREGFPFSHEGYTWTTSALRALFLVGPHTGHSVHPDSRKLMDAFLDDAETRGRTAPDRIRFVTYTTRYNRCYWVTVDGLERHYDRSEVDAQRDAAHVAYTVRTTNVSRLLLTGMDSARSVSLDGQSLAVQPASSLLFEKKAGRWSASAPSRDTALRKKHGLQGPIEDAFLDSFLCVTPTGRPWNQVADSRARREMERFSKFFTHYFRGDARTKADSAITAGDIADRNLVLFGDPGSNRVMARVIARLPIRWTRDSIVVGAQTFSAADHVAALIYPNPLNPKRYVVLNTGFTAQDGEQPLPRFGDCAVLKVVGGKDEIAAAGLFDDGWKLPR